MAPIPNPYQAPVEGDLDEGYVLPNWTTQRLVRLFFLPSLIFLICLVAGYVFTPFFSICGLVICSCGALAITNFSARLHQRRAQAGLGSFIGISLLYLVAQILALHLAFAIFTVVMRVSGLTTS